MQANSEISVLHLTNDSLNCSGLLLLSTIFVACWAYYTRVGIAYLFGGKLPLTFLFNVYKRFLFLSPFYVFNVLYFWGERSSSMNETVQVAYTTVVLGHYVTLSSRV